MGPKKNNKSRSKGKKAGGTNNKGSPKVEEDRQRKPFFLKEEAAKKKNAEAKKYLVKDDVRVRGLSTLSFTSAKSKAQPEESREYSSKIPFCDGIVWSCNYVKSQVMEDRFDVELTVYGARFDSAEPMPHPLDPSKQLQRGERIINGEEWKSKPMYVRLWCIEHYEANEECDIKSLNELKEAQTIAKKSSGNEESGSSGDSSLSPNASPASSGQQSSPSDGAQHQAVHQDNHAMSQSEEPALSGESSLSPNASPASSEQQSSPGDSVQHQVHQDSHAMSQSEETALSGDSSLSPNASPASSEQQSSLYDSEQHQAVHQDRLSRKRNASNNQAGSEVPGVPIAQHLSKVLNLGDDIFLARQIELVRKAIDSAAKGLHWHTMYTLVHSAALCQDPIGFEIKTKSGDPKQETLCATIDGDAKAWEHNDPDSMRNLMTSLYDFIEQTDVRNILKHVMSVTESKQKHSLRSWYYGKKAGIKAKQLLELLNAFYHRNAIMPTDEDKGETPGDIDRRETALTKMIFDDLSGLIKAVKFEEDTVNKLNSKSLQIICKDIGEVAEYHFEAVRRIQRQCLSHVDAREPQKRHQDAARSMEVLERLETVLLDGNSEPNDPATLEGDFVLLFLWARFGASKDDIDAVKDELKRLREEHKGQEGDGMGTDSTGGLRNAIEEHRKQAGDGMGTDSTGGLKNAFEHMKPLKLFFPKLEDIRANKNMLQGCPNIIKWGEEKSVDPFGLTNLDMAFRALDITGLALRRLLIECVNEMQTQQRTGPQIDEQNPYLNFRKKILEKISKKQDFPLIPVKSRRRNGQMVIFQHHNDSEVILLTEFCTRHRLEPTQLASILDFVTMDPHWGDTHFLLKFFIDYFSDKFKDPEDMRNILAHQKHMDQKYTLKYKKLKPKINEMVQQVEGICRAMGLDRLIDMEELLALRQLHRATHHLKHLRDRQMTDHLYMPESGADFREKAVASIRRLRRALCESSGGESDSSSLETDMSWGILNTGAIKQLLHLYDDNMRDTGMSRTSDNMFDLLGEDE